MFRKKRILKKTNTKNKKFNEFKKDFYEKFSIYNKKIEDYIINNLYKKIKKEDLLEIQHRLKQHNLSKISNDFILFSLAKKIDPKKDVSNQIKQNVLKIKTYKEIGITKKSTNFTKQIQKEIENDIKEYFKETK